MRYRDYVEYRCVNMAKLSRAVGIGETRLRPTKFDELLFTEEELNKLKLIIGDWSTFEVEVSQED